ncbi:AfsA-related hotdog domain-containing protein [Streptomyces carpinensis]|uniref:AfsA-related hotdog domain-containing protein n=1 Tax=Streptomyces carpinensis TaxID=66369 RepID=A0ABV1WFV3_9ACTN|nr:AfsA-related hotdog domain-containing protein [Streptomyces carpinensis]
MTIDHGTAMGHTVPAGPGMGTCHLIHHPSPRDHYLLDDLGPGEENFALAGEMPVAHPLFNDGPGRFHDAQIATETVREVGEFIGHRYFGVPDDRPGLFFRLALDLTDLSGWRSPHRHPGEGGVPVTTRIKVRPANVVDEVPRGLDFHIEILIDGLSCGTGAAGLVFLMPRIHRKHVEHVRRAQLAVPELDDSPDGPLRPATCAEVGRYLPENVVISEPTDCARGRLSTWVLTEGVNPVFEGDERQLTALHLMESLRQASLLAAGRAHGLPAERSMPVSCEVNFRGQADLDLPLRCVAVAGQLGRDTEGRPSVPVTLTVTQRRRTVAEARTRVVRDY